MSDTVHMEWTPERVQSFWDYESQFPQRYFTYTRASSLVARVKPFLKDARRIVDYGCGRGYLTEQLLGLGSDVVAAELGFHMPLAGRSRAPLGLELGMTGRWP